MGTFTVLALMFTMYIDPHIVRTGPWFGPRLSIGPPGEPHAIDQSAVIPRAPHSGVKGLSSPGLLNIIQVVLVWLGDSPVFQLD